MLGLQPFVFRSYSAFHHVKLTRNKLNQLSHPTPTSEPTTVVNFIAPIAFVGALLATTTAAFAPVANSTTSRRLADVAFTAWGLDMPGNDISNARAPRPDDCFAKCKGVARCRAFTWTNYEGGTCFFKTYWAKPSIYVGAFSGVLLEEAQSILSQGYRASFDNYDMPGFDLSSESGKDLEYCTRPCWANYKCKAVTWTSYNDGSCFYKNDVRACAPVAGATTRIVFNHLVTA